MSETRDRKVWVPLSSAEQIRLHKTLTSKAQPATDLTMTERAYMFAVLVLGERPLEV